VQGHSSPGVYARAYLDGRLTEAQLDMFRQEVDGKGNLVLSASRGSCPTSGNFRPVSMGLGPIQAIYQARFLHYLNDPRPREDDDRKVWAFMGDGEMDEPESLGAIGMAARENLDNLVFVVNCNLQRLDGPVRGNGKIIQELEADFRGAGWNVIKVIWGSYWDPLIARDKEGFLLKRMEDAVDGEYQKFKSRDGAYVREHFFGKYPELKAMVANMSDADIWRLNRGGHDPHKVYAAYAAAVKHKGQPTVILAKTVKGYGMGAVGEGKNIAHQQKKMPIEALKQFRDRFNIRLPDDKLADLPYYKPAGRLAGSQVPEGAPRAARGLPCRSAAARARASRCRSSSRSRRSPKPRARGREISTTMAFVRMLTALVKDKVIGRNVVPIVPDESRTFGMEGLFRQLGIYSQVGQLYEPEDSDQLMFYKEDKNGQILQEGINEAGAMCSWIAAATSYSNSNVPMIPVYIFYSMFGLQRVGDLCWAGGRHALARLPHGRHRGAHHAERRGAPARGRPQPHPRRHHPQLRVVRPHLLVRGRRDRAGRPAADGRGAGGRLLLHHPDERELPPSGPSGRRREGILKGMYRLCQGDGRRRREAAPRVQLLGSGTILREVMAAAELLKKDWGVAADVWSCPSFNELRRDGMATARWNLLHPAEKARARTSSSAWADAGAGDRVDRLHARTAPTRSASTSRAATRCSAPTASAAATRATTCGGSSR
jgi:pyruvate dehydrogenase E1 component